VAVHDPEAFAKVAALAKEHLDHATETPQPVALS
jgi:hypothetical protein